jgi:prepilin-type N-terminal cleavage/methylation domain-containing protein
MVRSLHPRPQHGFTLVELLVSMMVVVFLVVGLLQILDASAHVSKVQNDVAEMTETLRFTVQEMVRTLRMGGTGGLPLLAPGAGGSLSLIAVAVDDNVTEGSRSFGSGSQSRTARTGSDVLTVRGVIGGELYDVRGGVAIAGVDPNYTIRLDPVSPYSGQQQVLRSPAVGTPVLMTTIWELPVPLINGQTRFFSKYNIGLSTGFSSNADGSLDVSFTSVGANEDQSAILALNEDGTFQPFQEEYVITAGFLDDLVFFIADNDVGEPALYLFQRSDGSVTELVSNVADLQVALGCDVNPSDGTLTEVGVTTGDDEWFYNVAGETAPSAQQMALLHEVRLSLVARSAHLDPWWTSPADILPENAPDLTGDDLRYRYRSHSVRVTLRSHPPMS